LLSRCCNLPLFQSSTWGGLPRPPYCLLVSGPTPSPRPPPILPTSPRKLLTELYEAAIAGALPESSTRAAVATLDLRPAAPVYVIAIGKAALAMTRGTVAGLAEQGIRPAGGIVVAPEPGAGGEPTTRSSTVDREFGASLPIVFGDHPVPGSGSFAAAEAIGDAVAHVPPGAEAIVLVSGGGSSLAAAPAAEVQGFSQADLASLYESLLASGANIGLVNMVRKRFARWTGGRLAVALSHAHVVCLAVSDVPGDDPAAISSGPCAGDPTHVGGLVAKLRGDRLWGQLPASARDYLDAAARGQAPDTPKPDAPEIRRVATRIIVSNAHALESAAARARAAGIQDVSIESAALTGEAAIAGLRAASDLIARRKRARGARISRCVLWGGETTVSLPPGAPQRAGGARQAPLGGRSQELALAAARSFADAGDSAAGIALLAAGTDGRDGPTDAAGAIVDCTTWGAISAAGRDPAADLAAHDAYRALDAVGVLLRPGLTGTNVMDVAIGLIL
jgi:glycerate 2-kinase